jgi:hypothetical protein
MHIPTETAVVTSNELLDAQFSHIDAWAVLPGINRLEKMQGGLYKLRAKDPLCECLLDKNIKVKKTPRFCCLWNWNQALLSPPPLPSLSCHLDYGYLSTFPLSLHKRDSGAYSNDSKEFYYSTYEHHSQHAHFMGSITDDLCVSLFITLWMKRKFMPWMFTSLLLTKSPLYGV